MYVRLQLRAQLAHDRETCQEGRHDYRGERGYSDCTYAAPKYIITIAKSAAESNMPFRGKLTGWERTREAAHAVVY